MADPKDKGKGKPKSKGDSPAPSSGWTFAIGIIVGIVIIYQIISHLLVNYGFKDSETGIFNTHVINSFKISVAGWLTTLEAISIFICVLLIIGIIYIKFRVYEMKRLDNVKKKIKEISEQKILEKPEPNKKWIKVQEHINSANSSDWRLAILEADILLNEILEKMGYKGMTIGDKLKAIEISDFTNLNNAWEAHKIRNSIAHEGSDFSMNQNEAKRVIGLYEKVFKEFYFI